MNFFRRNKNFKFNEKPNTACFVCNHVFEQKLPILLVTHDIEDSNWQFLCGREDHDETNIRIISLENVTEIDPSVNDLHEMPPGVSAERESLTSQWKPFRNI